MLIILYVRNGHNHLILNFLLTNKHLIIFSFIIAVLKIERGQNSHEKRNVYIFSNMVFRNFCDIITLLHI